MDLLGPLADTDNPPQTNGARGHSSSGLVELEGIEGEIVDGVQEAQDERQGCDAVIVAPGRSLLDM